MAAKTALGRYLHNLLYSLDQLGNTVWGGDPDETISSRLGKMSRAGRLRFLPRVLVRVLDRIDADHCIEAIEEDRGGRALVDVERCCSAVVNAGVVVRCRKGIGHPGPHVGRFGGAGRRKWIEWG